MSGLPPEPLGLSLSKPISREPRTVGSEMTRRKLLTSGAMLGAGGLLSGCDILNQDDRFRRLLMTAEDANMAVQNGFGQRMALAREYPESAISPFFRGNGTQNPDTPEYNAAVADNFANWELHLTGLVERELTMTLADILAMPQRTQITRHDCVEGWSAIGKWTGVPLKLMLDAAGVRDEAQYVVFRCADSLSAGPYYESIALIDAYHPQTIIAHRLNDEALPVRNGAPLRLRVERQLGYKQAKYLTGIELVASLDAIHGGKGGYWEDKSDYAWYAGI